VLTSTGKKYGIREYIEELGLPHIYIDVGWWMQSMLPAASEEQWWGAAFTRRLYVGGKHKVALTDTGRIGDYVARIIEDPRTLNQYVFVWEDEKTQKEALEIAARAGVEIDIEKNSVRRHNFPVPSRPDVFA
jgi:hypothetical protein